MSNDGNKSTKRAPFTMFSSSAGGGYLDSFHTNFSGGVEINNLHTDVYGSYRNPPAQGPFNDDLVGGLAYRHQDIGTTSDRQEGFLINAETGSLSILQTGRVQIYRDEYAKRPLNIRNIKEVSGGLGNYEKEYEVVQIAGRTLNPRHFVEFPEQYTTDYPLHKGTENPVFNALDADGNPQTGSLSDYTLPDMTGSTDQFVFVNKFSAPGDRYTMSRGFLNPKGEEMSAYNASPFRNLNVRAELSADLSRHTPKATDIPPETNTEYHTTNRNTKYRKQELPQSSIQDLVEITGGATLMNIAIDTKNKRIHWVDYVNKKIQSSNLDGTDFQEFVVTGFPTGIAIDHYNEKLYWTEYGTKTINSSNLDGSSITSLITLPGSDYSESIDIDIAAAKLYFTVLGSDEIQRSNTDGTNVETIVTGLTTPLGIALDLANRKVYWSDDGTDKIQRANLDGSSVEDVLDVTSGVKGIYIDPDLGKLYWVTYLGTPNGKIQRANLDGTAVEDLITSMNFPYGICIDKSAGTMYWTNNGDDTIQRAKTPEKPVYDAGNVTHAIPQSSLQYTWIKDSAETTMSEFQGYATGSDIQFYSNSVGFDSPMNNIYIDPVNATQSFDFTGSVYTYGTWKEIRGGELGLSRYYRNHNILPVTNDEDNTTQYIEPPVVAKHKPLDYNLAIDGTLTPYSIKSPYGNVLMRYSNDDINKLYDFRVSDKNTEYTKIKDLYLNKSIADAGNPVKAFYSLTYGETVYPQSKNAFMKKVRVRGEYTEVAGTGNNGYDRLIRNSEYFL